MAERKKREAVYTWCTRCAEFTKGTAWCPRCGHDRRGFLPVRLEEERKQALQSDPGRRGH